MRKILKPHEINNLIKETKNTDESVVLVGGCFDLLHYGHVKFLEKAKEAGDILVVALENDQKIKRLKGENRPIHSQKQRAEILSALKCVDFIICLPLMNNNQDYFDLVKKIKPDVIAITEDDPQFKNKKKQAEMVSGKIKSVINHLNVSSTSEIIKLLDNY